MSRRRHRPPTGDPYPLTGVGGSFTGWSRHAERGRARADNQDHTASFLPLSSFLPPSEFPWFGTERRRRWTGLRPGGERRSSRTTGEWYVYSGRGDENYKRLTRTVDLTGATSGELRFWTSFDTEPDWDFLFVEAHEVGTDNWTTLPDVNGHTVDRRPATAAPRAGTSCTRSWPTTRTSARTASAADRNDRQPGTPPPASPAAGRSGSSTCPPYAGKQVELSITYASDWGTEGLGVFVDDVRVIADGAPLARPVSRPTSAGGPCPGRRRGPRRTTATGCAPNSGSRRARSWSLRTRSTPGSGSRASHRRSANDFVKRSLQHLSGAAPAPAPPQPAPPQPVAPPVTGGR